MIGVGRIGRLHATLLAHRVREATLVAVCDADAAAAHAVGRELGVPVAASADELFGDGNVEAVAICSPTPTHVELVAGAARAGKAIFCEKPLSLQLDGLEQALAAVADGGVPLGVGFNRRHDLGHRSVAEAVASRRVGEAHVVRITSRDPAPPPLAILRASGGLFLDMTIHDFDMARFVTGSEVDEVFAVGSVRVDPRCDDLGDIDTALVTLVHSDGCFTSIDNSRRATYGYDQRVEVHGSAAMAASGNRATHAGFVSDADGTTSSSLPAFFAERYIDAFVSQWQAFIGAVQRGEHPSAGPDDARAALVIGLSALCSLREGRSVRTAEFAGDVASAGRAPRATDVTG